MTLGLTFGKESNVQAPPRVAKLVKQLEQIVYMEKLGWSVSMGMFTLQRRALLPAC
jgi:hypothetical protein